MLDTTTSRASRAACATTRAPWTMLDHCSARSAASRGVAWAQPATWTTASQPAAARATAAGSRTSPRCSSTSGTGRAGVARARPATVHPARAAAAATARPTQPVAPVTSSLGTGAGGEDLVVDRLDPADYVVAVEQAPGQPAALG